MPAIRAFAFYAGMALLFNFVLQFTCFIAIMSLDITRREENRFDLLCWLVCKFIRLFLLLFINSLYYLLLLAFEEKQFKNKNMTKEFCMPDSKRFGHPSSSSFLFVSVSLSYSLDGYAHPLP